MAAKNLAHKILEKEEEDRILMTHGQQRSSHWMNYSIICFEILRSESTARFLRLTFVSCQD